MVTICASAQIATKVSWYTLPVSLPDVTQIDFGTARDNLMVQLQTARITSTQSRIGRTTGLEIRKTFEVGDMVVSTNSIWRGDFDALGYANMTGNRVYCPWILVGDDGQVSLDRCGYSITCDQIALLGNTSSLNGLPYSVSRRGIRKGADGVLFTVDDEIVMSGLGTQAVDAIVFIGGRIGALVNVQGDIDYIDGQISSSGMNVEFENQFISPVGILSSKQKVIIYPQGSIPTTTNMFVNFKTPVGWLFSVEGPPGSLPFELRSSREVNGPWTLVNSAATEGSSAFVEYVGDISTNRAFASKNEQQIIIVPTVSLKMLPIPLPGVIQASISSDLDQDRP